MWVLLGYAICELANAIGSPNLHKASMHLFRSARPGLFQNAPQVEVDELLMERVYD